METLSQSKAILNILLGSICIALAPFFIEYSGFDAITSSFYRLVIGACTFFTISFIRQEKLPEKKFWGLYLVTGLFITLDLVVWNQSLILIGSGLATVLANLEVVFLILIGFFIFKEKFPEHFFRKTFFILIGIACLLFPYLSEIHPNQAIGIGYGLEASLIYSIYLLLIRIVNKKNPNVSITINLAIICAYGAFVLGIYMLFDPNVSFDYPRDWKCVSCIVLNTILSQILGWSLVARGITGVSLSLAGILLLTQPALTFLCDCLFFGRNTQIIQIIGCIIILLSIYFILRTQKLYQT